MVSLFQYTAHKPIATKQYEAFKTAINRSSKRISFAQKYPVIDVANKLPAAAASAISAWVGKPVGIHSGANKQAVNKRVTKAPTASISNNVCGFFKPRSFYGLNYTFGTICNSLMVYLLVSD